MIIKTIYLEYRPEMDNISALEILSELDTLNKDTNHSTVLVGSDHKVYKDQFITPNYFITFLKIKTEDDIMFLSMKKLYEILQLSVPCFLKVMSVGDTLIIVTPRYSDIFQDASYSVMMEELIRFTSYAYKKTNGDDIETSIMVKEYVGMCISYPGNRSNNSYMSEDETGKN